MANKGRVRVTQKDIEEIRAQRKQNKKKGEPTEIREEFYNSDLTEIFKYYNEHYNGKQKKDISVAYFRADQDAIQHLSSLSHQHYHTLGALIRMKENGVVLKDGIDNRIEQEKDRLVQVSKELKFEEELAKQNIEPERPVDPNAVKVEKFNYFLGDFESIFDDVYLKRVSSVNFISYFEEHKPTNAQLKQLVSLIQEKLEEFQEVKKEKELLEAYAISKKEADSLLKFLNEALSATSLRIQQPTNRPKKVKSLDQLSAKVRYLKSEPNLGIESIEPRMVIGKKTCVAFNTKNRKLIIFRSLQDEGFSFNGTTLYNIDMSSSKQKTIRDPKTQLLNLLQLNKSGFDKGFNLIKSVETEPSPRFTEDLLILRTF